MTVVIKPLSTLLYEYKNATKSNSAQEILIAYIKMQQNVFTSRVIIFLIGSTWGLIVMMAHYVALTNKYNHIDP